MGLRIISGNLKGRKLFTLAGKDIRPTSDRLRESIFSILSQRVSNAVLLDLFAGTGAFGIEALSRGAQFGVFIDNHKKALNLIKTNIHSCSLDTKTKIIRWDIQKNLNCLISTHRTFDLVFMDPPYNKNLIHAALKNLHLSKKLVKNACIIIEHSSSESIPKNILGFIMADQRKYGTSVVSLLNYNA